MLSQDLSNLRSVSAPLPVTKARRYQSRLSKRVESAQSILFETVRSNKLSEGLSGATNWALVGGVLRDLMLSEPSAQLPIPLLAWPDIDVAVAEGDISISEEILQILDSRMNSFGGLKAYSANLGSIDMWSWPSQSPGTIASDAEWKGILGNCDFGVNAIAYAWPLCRVVIHSQWLRDVNLRRSGGIFVETLNQSASPAIHGIRGIALRQRLQASHPSKEVRFGPRFEELLGQLKIRNSAQELEEMRVYATYKIEQGKWRPEILSEAEVIFGP